MRSLVLSAIAASLVFFVPASAQAERYCIGGCGSYSNPNYAQPELPDETGFDGHRDYSDDGPDLYEPEYEDQSAVGEPVYAQPRQRRYRERGHNNPRRYRESYERPVYDEPAYDPYAGRTEFCRESVEKRGHGWGKKKVKVRRCVWVRNDLVPNYRADGGYTSSW